MTKSSLDSCTELVVVCCHAIYNTNAHDPWDEASWLLKPFQKSDRDSLKISEHFTFISHIQAAAESLRRPDTYVIFSGGATDPTNPWTESGSYAGAFMDLYPDEFSVMRGDRWGLESNATDSYQNLLFSIVEFRKRLGRYPDTITVITHAFKSNRFLQLHGPAIRWPQNRLRVLGINPPFSRPEFEQVQQAEHENAFALFRTDPYGIGPQLDGKRCDRGWSGSKVRGIANGLERSVRNLLLHGCLEDTSHEDRLPWEL